MPRPPHAPLASLAVSVALAACGDTAGPAAGWSAEDTGTTDTAGAPIDTAGLDDRIAVATFNVERFFDTRCDSGDCDSGFESVPSEAQFAFRTTQIADAIRAMDVDAVLLQEVESDACVVALGDELGADFAVRVIGETGGASSLDTAVVARDATLMEVRSHRGRALLRPDGSTTSFTRDLAEVHLDVGGTRVVVFSAHFKSKSNDDPGRRYAEAEAARAIVAATTAEFPDALVVFGGDLNDEPGSAPLTALEAGGDLFRVGSLLEPGADGTHRFGGDVSAIDHLYLARRSRGAVVSDSIAVRRDASGGLGGSDHAALRATFAF